MRVEWEGSPLKLMMSTRVHYTFSVLFYMFEIFHNKKCFLKNPTQPTLGPLHQLLLLLPSLLKLQLKCYFIRVLFLTTSSKTDPPPVNHQPDLLSSQDLLPSEITLLTHLFTFCFTTSTLPKYKLHEAGALLSCSLFISQHTAYSWLIASAQRRKKSNHS